MEYNEPDARWAIFGMPDFENYCEKSVVKGLFHPGVPKDVVEAFEVAEYMMAHAYYHYKLYDEAYSKLLLIIEMAIKLRCADFNIPIEVNGKNGKTKDIPLEQLIIKLCKLEPLKKIVAELQWVRQGRNNKMHPKSHTFSGSIANYEKIKHGVVLLNKLFISEQIINEAAIQTEKFGGYLRQFDKGLHILENGDLHYLIEGVKIIDCLFVNNEWQLFLVADPITKNIGQQVRSHNYATPFTLVIKNIKIENGNLSMNDAISGHVIKIAATKNPVDTEFYMKFVEEREAAKSEFEGITIIQTSSPFGQQHNDFLYKWLWQVS